MVLTSAAAATRIQKWIRSKLLHHQLKFVSNFREVDCLTLAPIRSMTLSQCFFMTLPNGNLVAADSRAWLEFFVRHGTHHPATRTPIDPVAVWNCYFISRLTLPRHSPLLEACTSKALLATSRNERKKQVVKLVPKSPLYRVSIIEIRTMEMPCKKRIVYQLNDSRNGELVDPRYFRVEIKTAEGSPVEIEVSF